MSLLNDASLLITPNAYKQGKLYSVIPSNGNGDFSVTRATTKTRTDSSGLVVNVPINEPALDYSLGSCPNILLEPQRTNLVTFSEQLDNAAWTKPNTIATANSTTSPSGVQNADTFTANGASSQHRTDQTLNVISGTTYTWSVYAKKNTNNFIQLTGFDGGFGAIVFANFDLNNGVVGSVGVGTTASIQSVGNGWYRCSINLTAILTGTSGIQVYIVTSATAARKETNTLSTSVFLWGAQLEAGAYATSYIPTTSASVTRNLDIVQATGVSSLIGQTEGTIYWEGTMTSGLDDLFYLNRSATNSVFIYKNSNNTIVFRIYYGGVALSIGNATPYTGLVKIAAAYKNGDSVLYINGVQTGISATAFTFTGALTDVVLNNSAFLFGNATKSVKTAALFPTRLTNAQLAALTA
jgi:hypothetical protein